MDALPRWVWRIFAFCVLLGPPVAHAALFCADTVAAVQFALTVSGENAQDNQIEIVAGSYALTDTLAYSSSSANQLTIIGGYTAGCAALSNAYTVLSGGAAHAVMLLSNGSTSTLAGLHVERITFLDGKTSVDHGGGGLYAVTMNGDVRLENNRFLFNQSSTGSGGMYAETNGLITVRNNLFYGNSAGGQAGAGGLQTQGSVAYVIGNTIFGNSTQIGNGIGGLYISGSASTHFWLSSNILWSNNTSGGVDLYAAVQAILRNNDIGTKTLFSDSPSSEGNLSADPMFAPCGSFLCASFNLKRASPLVDAGDDQAPSGTGSFDLEYKPRKIGAHVDIGAFEEDVLFADGFE